MKLITPFTILNQNFHEMDLIRDAMKTRRGQINDLLFIFRTSRYYKLTERVKLHLIPLWKLENHVGSILRAINIYPPLHPTQPFWYLEGTHWKI